MFLEHGTCDGCAFGAALSESGAFRGCVPKRELGELRELGNEWNECKCYLIMFSIISFMPGNSSTPPVSPWNS